MGAKADGWQYVSLPLDTGFGGLKQSWRVTQHCERAGRHWWRYSFHISTEGKACSGLQIRAASGYGGVCLALRMWSPQPGSCDRSCWHDGAGGAEPMVGRKKRSNVEMLLPAWFLTGEESQTWMLPPRPPQVQGSQGLRTSLRTWMVFKATGRLPHRATHTHGCHLS